MDRIIFPGRLAGTVPAIPSKSDAHRCLIAAGLARGASRLYGLRLSGDIGATLDGIRALGANIIADGDALAVTGGNPPGEAAIDCRDSAATLRFLLPVAGALGVRARFAVSGQLSRRPLAPLTDELGRHGLAVRADGGIQITGKLIPGLYRLPGDISSQFVSGLLMALPLLDGDSELRLTTPLESKPYAGMTIDTLARHGIGIAESGGRYRVRGKQRYQPADHSLEGDYSAAANWLAANALGSEIAVEHLPADTRQGDRAIVDVLAAMTKDGGLSAVALDARQIPDLFPILAVVAAFAGGESVLSGVGRLRYKESDRLAAMTAALTAIGADVTEQPDALVIRGKAKLAGNAAVDCAADHRVAMAMAVAALRCERPVTLLGADCVTKSYPDFFRDFEALGGTGHVL